MELAAGLVDEADLEAAIGAESLVDRSLMPPSPVKPLLIFKAQEIADWALRRAVGPFLPVPQQIVTVRKQRHGVRPVAELFLRDQLLYRALTEPLAARLAPPSRQTQSYDDFRRAPLSDSEAAYVVSSDISAFYQYIDYSVLAQELRIRTGDGDRTSALLDLLEGVTGRTFGIPQQSETSDILAEAYIDIVHRRLVRRGLRVWRYNDDWRITAGSWSQALHAVDLLESEARQVGLTLNDFKTIIRTRKTYEQDIEHRETVLRDIAEEAELDLTDFIWVGHYETRLVKPDQDAVQLEASRQILLRYAEHRSDDLQDPQVFQTLLQLLPGALITLAEAVSAGTKELDPQVLEICVELLRKEQNLTPQVSRYIMAGVDSDESAVLDSFDQLLGQNPYLTPWQAAWLGPNLGRATGFASGALGSTRAAWLLSVWNDNAASEPVRSGLAMTLARHKIIAKGDLLDAYDSYSETGRPGIAAALGVAQPDQADPAVMAMCKEDELARMAYDWAARVG